MLAEGTMTLNRLMDRAGRHRRLAAGFLLLVVPVCFMGLVLLQRRMLIPAVCHFAVAGSFVVISIQLFLRGSLVDSRGVPHLGLAGLLSSVMAVRWVAPDGLTEAFGATPALGVGFVILAGALMVLAFADRNLDPLVALVGRGLLVLGGTVSGCVQLLRFGNGFETQPYYAGGLGVVGLLLLGMSLFEARMLRRAIQLALLSAGGR
jgi:hypothetical protein